MNTTHTHPGEANGDRNTAASATAGLGEIIVQRDALQARARAEALLFTIRTVRQWIAAARRHRTAR